MNLGSKTRIGYFPVLLLSAAICAEVLAQAQSTPANQIEEVLVLGLRQANRAAIAEKRKSGVIADFLGVDELGRAVDLNIAESLRLVPGVNTIFDEDEGRFVTVRGLDSNFTFVSIDGAQLASVDRNSRRVNTEMIPPTAVKALAVYKTLTPEMEGNAIGGHVDLVTRSAFDNDGLFAVLNGTLGFHTTSGDVPGGDDGASPKVDGAVSNTFGSDNQYGFVLAGQYFDKTRDQRRYESLGYELLPDGDTSVELPFVQDYRNTIERRSVLGRLEAKPSDHLYAHLNANYFFYQYDEVRNRNVISASGDATGTGFLEGSVAEASGQHRTNTFPLEFNVLNVYGGFEYKLNEKNTIDFLASNSNATNDEPSLQIRWLTPTSPELGYDYSLAAGNDGVPAIELNNPAAFSDLSNYTFNRFVDSEFNAEEDISTVEVNWGFNLDQSGFGFKVGARYRTLEKTFRNRETDYRLAPGADPISGSLVAFETITSPDPGIEVPISNFQAFLDYFDANRDQFVGTSSDGANTGRNFELNEDVAAAYGLVQYVGNRYAIVGGVRYERTETDSDFFQQNADGSFVPARTSGSYDDFLPSLSGTYNVSENVLLRGAFSQALGRPNFIDLAGSSRVRFLSDDAETGLPNLISVSSSNPELDPRRSNNFDLSVEWYIDEGEFFSAAVFYKDIDDYIFNEATETMNPADVPGLVLPPGSLAPDAVIEYSRPVNAEQATIGGFEVQYYKEKFDFLPGFLKDLGIIANYTYIDGELDLPSGESTTLPEQPDDMYNLTVTYTTDALDARLTYAFTGEFISRLDTGDVSRSRYQEEYGTFDFSSRYYVSNNIAVTFEARNITDEERKTLYGPSSPEFGAVRETNDFGQSFWLGVALTY